MPRSVPVVRVAVFTPDGDLAPFHLTFFGIPATEFYVTPGGGYKIREALERRGLDGYMSSPFSVTALRYPGPSPKRAPPAPTPPPPAPDPVDVAISRQGYRLGRRERRQ